MKDELIELTKKAIRANMLLAFEEAVTAMGGDSDDFNELWAVSESAKVAQQYLTKG